MEPPLRIKKTLFGQAGNPPVQCLDNWCWVAWGKRSSAQLERRSGDGVKSVGNVGTAGFTLSDLGSERCRLEGDVPRRPAALDPASGIKQPEAHQLMRMGMST